MRTKKQISILLCAFVILICLLAACKKDPVSDESNYFPGFSQNESAQSDSVSAESNVITSETKTSQISEATISTPVEESSKPDESQPVIENPQNKYLSVLNSTLTDNGYFVVVGKCEEGATVTATTSSQNVTSTSDRGYFSVRIKQEGALTRVKLVAKGKLTEQYTFDVDPIIPSRDMWSIVGANGYNFFFQKMMPDFMQTNTLSSSQMSNITNKIKNRVESLKQQSPNTKIIYMVVPSKASIYPELVPSDYPKGTGTSRLEQMNSAIEAGGAKVINLLDVFKQHKNDDYKLYWKTDSHWTDYGAFVAYTELFNYISKDFPAAAPKKMSDFNFAGDFYEGGDMIYYMMMSQSETREYCWYRTPKFKMLGGISDVTRYRKPDYLMYSDNLVPEIQFNTGKSNLPDLYVLRDSYSAQIFDILADRGNKTVYKSMWNLSFNLYDVANYNPDYVIYICSEWNIDSIIQG